MLSATPELIAFLNANSQGVSIPIFTLTLRDGTVHRWARNPTDVSFGGTTWLAHGRSGRPLIRRQGFRAPVGLDEVGTCEVQLGCDDTTVLGSTQFALAAARGALSGATLLFERAYCANPGDAIVGKLFRFKGDVVRAPSDSHGVVLAVESRARRLRDTVLPKTLVSKSCTNALYDTACGVTKATYTTAATTTTGSTRMLVKLTGTWATDHWNLGTIEITSGALAGEKRGIRSSVNPGDVYLTDPLPEAPASGVSVNLVLGCDHTTGAAGCSRFANRARFRGQIHLPREEG